MLGDTSQATFSIRFDHNDKYLAAGCQDGTIKIYNIFTGKQSYILNQGMEVPMPVTNIKWRPICAPGVTKNVIISLNSDGSLEHWHTTSGKRLHQIKDDINQLLAVDYKPDGMQFTCAGNDTVVRIYDEQTRQVISELTGGGGGEPGHGNRVQCVKYDKEDPNLIVTGGWDMTVLVWDSRTNEAVRSIKVIIAELNWVSCWLAGYL